jgi:hypothetical protein
LVGVGSRLFRLFASSIFVEIDDLDGRRGADELGRILTSRPVGWLADGALIACSIMAGPAPPVSTGAPPRRDSLMAEDADMPLINKGSRLFRLFGSSIWVV